MRIDCKTPFGYFTERRRMCYHYKSVNGGGCDACGFCKLPWVPPITATQQQIDFVQKWSDENPIGMLERILFSTLVRW